MKKLFAKHHLLCHALALACIGVVNPSQADMFQAENYTTFFDKTPGNTGGLYRTDDVDIESALDTGNGYNVGWIDASEWLVLGKLTIPTTGEYTFNARVASPTGGELALDLNGGTYKIGNIKFLGTGGWQKWSTASVTTTLNAGTYNLGAFAVTGGWNLNWVEVVPVNPCQSTTPYQSAIALPGKLEAENYDRGCEGIAFSDADATNNGGQYRNDSVDIEAALDTGLGYNIGWTQPNEWLTYTVNIAKAGQYSITARAANGTAANGILKIGIDSTDGIASLTLPPTGGWQSWKDVTVNNISLPAGSHKLKLSIVNAGFNLNYLDIKAADSGCVASPTCANKARGEWTLVVIPDTQHYSQNRANAPLANMQKGFDWIVASKDNLNIKFVQGLGDITETWDNAAEWTNSSSAWYKLYGQVPFMPIQGNHDSPVALNKYFPISSFSREPWWGGAMSGIENNYALMTIGREQYMFLQLQPYDQYSKTPIDGLNWGKQILAQFPNKRVILATHDLWATTTIKDNLLTKFDNIILANAGHDCVRQASYITSGPRGGISYNFISDFQCDAQEVMYMRYYVFKPLEDKVDYYTYSPVLNKFLTDSASQGSFPLTQLDP